MKLQPFFNFFILADTDILSTVVNFLLVQFSEFSYGSVCPITHPRFRFNINVWLCLKHFCVVTFFCTRKTGDTKFPLIQFSELSISSVFPVNHLRFRFNIYGWLRIKTSMLGHPCMVTFLHY